MLRRSPESFSPEETGKMHELGLLGVIKVTPELKKTFLKLGGNPDTGYMFYNRAIELVKEFQPWKDPTNPSKDFLRELRIATIEALGLKTGEDDNLKIYTACGKNPLDVYHGVDAFVEWEDDEGGKKVIKRVTIDVTNHPAKKEGYKADVVAFGIPDPSDDEDAYLERVEELGEEIADHFQDLSRRSEGEKIALAA